MLLFFLVIWFENNNNIECQFYLLTSYGFLAFHKQVFCEAYSAVCFIPMRVQCIQ